MNHFNNSTFSHQSYAAILKSLKSSVNPEELGISVLGIRDTRSKDLLVEMKCVAKDRGRLDSVFRDAIAESRTVPHLVPHLAYGSLRRRSTQKQWLLEQWAQNVGTCGPHHGSQQFVASSSLYWHSEMKDSGLIFFWGRRGAHLFVEQTRRGADQEEEEPNQKSADVRRTAPIDNGPKVMLRRFRGHFLARKQESFEFSGYCSGWVPRSVRKCILFSPLNKK